MESRYFKPHSVTWWSGVALVAMGIIRGIGEGFNLGPVALVIDAWTGGIGPSVLIAQGAGVIGLRAQL